MTLVGQGENLYLALCTGNALAVELKDTAMPWLGRRHHFAKRSFWVNPHVCPVLYLMIALSDVKSLAIPRFFTPPATQCAHVHLNLCVEYFSSSLSLESFVSRFMIMMPHITTVVYPATF